MITANELRIGNWVDVSHNISTVMSVRLDGIHVMGNAIVNRPDQVDPIPLTAEILLACGFVKDKDGDYWIDLVTNYLKAIFMNDGVYPVWFCVAELSLDREQMASLNRIHSLHQLQNLYFALIGEELPYNPSTNVK